VEPTSEVYAGMVVAESSRADDMDINITKDKQLTNMRAASTQLCWPNASKEAFFGRVP